MADVGVRVAQGPPIYEFIRSRLQPSGRLDDSGLELPDESKVGAGELRWAAGAMDGVMGRETAGGPAQVKADKAASLFAKAARRPTPRRLRKLYTAVSENGALDYVDPMIKRLGQLEPDLSRLHDLGRWLATTSPDRGAVKIGLAILGVTGLGNDLDVVKALGAHDEFTLYAAVAIGNGTAEPDRELWALAQVVDGWGRIQCVERLRGTTDPEIRSWLLRSGYRNAVMYEYLAFIAATTGDLLTALRSADVDREMLTAAGEILGALVAGGPAEGMDDYAEGPEAVGAFLDHMLSRAETLDDFHAVAAIESFLAQDDGWEVRAERGWTDARRQALRARCSDILNRSEWTTRIDSGLRSDDREVFWEAGRAARLLGIDTFELHFERVSDDPLDGPWFQAWEQADESRAGRLVELARRTLPLEEIGTGTGNHLGLAPPWRAHSALDWTLQKLNHHPGLGGDLLLVALRSPVTRNRNLALQALQEWPAAQWPPGARAAIAQLAESDPNEHTQHRARDILNDPSS